MRTVEIRATPRPGQCEIANRDKSARIFAACAFLYSRCITRKCFPLKMDVEVMEYNIRNGSNQWQISTSIKATLEHFASSRRFQNFKICDRKNVGQRHDVQHTSYPMAIITFAFFQCLLVKIATFKV